MASMTPGLEVENATGPTSCQPRGSCNFRNLNSGSTVASCGCLTFWPASPPRTARKRQRHRDRCHERCGHHHQNQRVKKRTRELPGRGRQSCRDRSTSSSGRLRSVSSSSTSSSDLDADGTGPNWCMCGHHACYHDSPTPQPDRPPTLDRSVRSTDMPGLKSLSVSGYGRAMACDMPDVQSARLDGHQPLIRSVPRRPIRESTRYETAPRADPSCLASLPFQSGPARSTRAVPVDHTMTHSRLSRETSLKRSAYGLGLNILYSQNKTDHLHEQSRCIASSLPSTICGPDIPIIPFEDALLSATEAATPSIAARTPDAQGLREATSNAKPAISGTSHQATLSQKGRTVQGDAIKTALPQLSQVMKLLEADANVTSELEAFQLRLLRLENASFSHAPTDELHDRFDLIEARLVDLEQRAEDHDKVHAAQDSGSKAITSFNSTWSCAGTNSVGSMTSSALVSAALQRADSEARISALEGRLNDFETSAPPSFARPWTIEVVFLPWGQNLRGVWSPADGWTGDDADGDHKVQSDCAKPTHLAHWDSWGAKDKPTESKQAHVANPLTSHDFGQTSGWSKTDIHKWASKGPVRNSARACSTGGAVYRRLKSRGLIKSVLLTESSAHEVQKTVRSAFSKVWEEMEAAEKHCGHSLAGEDDGDFHSEACARSPLSDRRSNLIHTFTGLTAPFVPLRKVHKSSKLRFLTKAEMITPASWTAQFLNSGVIMRAAGGVKRLFVTQPEAYLQNNPARSSANCTCFIPGWTWRRLRELPRDQSSADNAGESEDGGLSSDNIARPILKEGVGEADAKEECWEYHAGLDNTQSALDAQESMQEKSAISVPRAEATMTATQRKSSGGPLESTRRENVRVVAGAARRHCSSSMPVTHFVHPISPLSELLDSSGIVKRRRRYEDSNSNSDAPSQSALDTNKARRRKRRHSSSSVKDTTLNRAALERRLGMLKRARNSPISDFADFSPGSVASNAFSQSDQDSEPLVSSDSEVARAEANTEHQPVPESKRTNPRHLTPIRSYGLPSPLPTRKSKDRGHQSWDQRMHSALKERLSSSDEIFDNSENADPHSCNRELVTDGVSDVVATTHDLAALVSVAATAAIPYDGYSIAREAYATPYSGTVNMINNDYFGNECLLLNRVDHNATSLFRTSFVGVGEDVWEGVDNADGDDHLALTGSDGLI